MAAVRRGRKEALKNRRQGQLNKLPGMLGSTLPDEGHEERECPATITSAVKSPT